MKTGSGFAVAVFGARHALTLRWLESRGRSLVSVCLYDFEQGRCAAALREAAESTFSDEGRRFHAKGPGFEATVMRSGHALDLYGNAARFDGGAPMLFDVILTGRNHEGASLLRYVHADGRAVCGGKDWLFSPASASGVLIEYAGGAQDAALTLTPKGFVSEPCPPATMRAGASAGRLFRRARLACAAGYFQDGTGLPGVHTPFITEKIR